MKELLKTINLTKDYKKFKLKDINISINAGDIYGLVGPNGAGKTTLLKLIANHENPSSGYIETFGREGDVSRKVGLDEMGFMIDMNSMYSYLSGYDNLVYIAKLRGLNIKDKYVEELFKFFKIDSFKKRKFKSYSTGMKQRVQLVAALLNRPKILVLDEPVNGLDPDGILELRNYLKKYAKENEAAIIISSHILSELDMIATRYGFIKNGEILEEISAEDLKQKGENYTVLEFYPEDLEEGIATLEEKNVLKDYKVFENNIVNIYEDVNLKEIQKILASKEIYLKSSTKKEESLEEYYVNLMGGQNE